MVGRGADVKEAYICEAGPNQTSSMSALCEADTRHLSAQTDRWSFSGPVRAAASWIALAVAKAMFSTSHQGGLNRYQGPRTPVSLYDIVYRTLCIAAIVAR